MKEDKKGAGMHFVLRYSHSSILVEKCAKSALFGSAIVFHSLTEVQVYIGKFVWVSLKRKPKVQINVNIDIDIVASQVSLILSFLFSSVGEFSGYICLKMC